MMHRLFAGLLLTFFYTGTFATNNLLEPSVSRLDYQLRDMPVQLEATPTSSPSLTPTPFPTIKPDEITSRDPQTPPSALPEIPAKIPQHPDLWSRMRVGFRMPDLDTATTRKWEQYYAARPEYLNRIIDRGRRYLYFVVEEVEKRGVPMEIALLPMIESAYNPRAESPARAAGMWQFIPETGKRYGLERTWWYDGRRDVVSATSAALDYLTEIHAIFNDWQLALASYNWGENAVARAVAKSHAAGRAPIYAELRMPVETANYVPKLMAVRNIIADPDAYGVRLTHVPNQPYFVAIDNTRHMDVKVAAQLAETPVDELLRLNPGFIRPVIAQKNERKLVLPANKVETFQRNLASYDKPLLNWQPYVTRPGEAFDKLAKLFSISTAELKDVNDIALKERAARGQTILVPKTGELDVSDRQTLAALAANRVAEPVDRGEKYAPQPVHITRPYRVAKGDTVFSIAKRYKITVAQLQALNGIKGTNIKVGDTLRVAAAPAVPAPALAKKKPTSRTAQQYIARRGDTLLSVARKFNVASADIVRWNNLPSKELQPGIRLMIY